ncbi:mCG148390 [Mus musculus]|nr:mCG148390 [Mus musculus]
MRGLQVGKSMDSSPSWWGRQGSWSRKQLSQHIHQQEKEKCSTLLLSGPSPRPQPMVPARESYPHGLTIPPQLIQSRWSPKACPGADLLLSFHCILRFLMV